MTNFRHGHGKASEQSATYRSWAAMKRRCDNPNAENYKFYGGKGISYDPRWAEFSNFLVDMGERPEGTTLDRVRGEEGYYKNNCRWSTRSEQSANSGILTARQVVLIKALHRAKRVGISTRKWADIVGPLFKISPNTARRIITDPKYRQVSDGI